MEDSCNWEFRYFVFHIISTMNASVLYKGDGSELIYGNYMLKRFCCGTENNVCMYQYSEDNARFEWLMWYRNPVQACRKSCIPKCTCTY